MAETLTSRLGLIRYGSGNDMLTRDDFNAEIDILEASVAMDESGDTRPTAGKVGRYWTSTVTDITYRDKGSGWSVLGSKTEDQVTRPSTAASTAFTIQALNSQSGPLVRIKNDVDVDLFVVSGIGDVSTRASRFSVKAVPGPNEKVLTLTTTTTDTKPLSLVIPDASTKNFLEVQKATGGVTFSVAHDGQITTTVLNSGRSVITAISDVTPLAIKGASGQTNDLTQWRKSDNTLLAYMTVDGVDVSNKKRITGSDASILADTNNPGFLIGAGGAPNLVMIPKFIQGRNNGTPDDLSINALGGAVNIGNDTGTSFLRLRGQVVRVLGGGFNVTVASTFDSTAVFAGKTSHSAISINGHNLFLQATEPVGTTEDIWIQTA